MIVITVRIRCTTCFQSGTWDFNPSDIGVELTEEKIYSIFRSQGWIIGGEKGLSEDLDCCSERCLKKALRDG